MRKQMESELMFPDVPSRDLAIAELSKRGFEIELLLDRVDRHEGIVLTSTVWIKVSGPSELDEDEFFDEMAHLAEQFNGEVLETGPSP